MPKFKIKLFQHEWINTEQFEFEAEDEADAIFQAEKFVEEEKELEVDYRFEAEEIEQPKVENKENEEK